MLHAERRTDVKKLIVAFRIFENAPKKREEGVIAVFFEIISKKFSEN